MKLMKLLLLVVLGTALVSCTTADDGGNASGNGGGEIPAIEAVSEIDGAAICEENTPATDPATEVFPAPTQVTQEGVDYVAVMCTSEGAITIDLFEDATPVTVNNFVFLAQVDYYNNQIFHRVLEDFMAQGGDPTGTGTGGPGYRFQDEIVQGLEFDRPYLLAMANAGPGTNGSQFFITFEPTPWLTGAHTIFGEVIDGQDVVDSITLRDPRIGGEATDLITVVIVEREA